MKLCSALQVSATLRRTSHIHNTPKIFSRSYSSQRLLRDGVKAQSRDHQERITIPSNFNKRIQRDTRIPKTRGERVNLKRESDEQILQQLKNRSGGPFFHETVFDHETNIQIPRSLGEIRPGDFVEVHVKQIIAGVVLPAEVLGDVQIGARQYVVLTVSGELKTLSLSDFVLSFPSFIKGELLQHAAVQLQSDSKSRSDVFDDVGGFSLVKLSAETAKAMAEICKLLRTLLYRAEVEKSRLFSAFEKRYLSTSQRKTSLATQLTVMDITHQLMIDLGRTEEEANEEMNSPEKLYAIHQLLISSPDIFRLDPTSHRFTNTFSVLLPANQDALETVREDVEHSLLRKGGKALGRQPLPPTHDEIERFSEKVKEIRSQILGPKHTVVAEGNPRTLDYGNNERAIWTKSDMNILLFLRSAVGIRRDFATEATYGLIFHILKRCGYGFKVNVDTLEGEPEPFLQSVGLTKLQISRMLREIGLLTPWDNMSNLENEFQSLTESRPPPPKVSLKDCVDEDEALRKDVYSEVYVIDDADAQELDDGISLERTKDPNQSWVHIHIADPTTFIRLDDEAGLFAAKRGSTIYTPEGTWPMLSKEYIERLGLLVKPGEKYLPSSRFAMTFSAKLDHQSGAALDFKIELSRLHNVRTITYSQVTKMINSNETEDQDSKTLKTLAHLANMCEKRRMDMTGAFMIKSAAKGEAKLSPLPLPTSPIRSSPFENLASQRFAGFPLIEVNFLEFDRRDGTVTDARFVISEFASLACKIAGRWMEEHNVPALYRCQLPHGTAEEMKEFRKLKSSTNVITAADVMKHGHQLNPAMLSCVPAQHFFLGIRTDVAFESAKSEEGKKDVLLTAGYVRTTSPLRRFSDLMMHWQIRYTIRSMSKAKHEEEQRIPYTFDELRKQVTHLTRKEAWIRSMQISSNHFWIGLKLHRAFLARMSEEKRKTRLDSDQYANLPSVESDLKDEFFNSILEQDQDALVLSTERSLANKESTILVTLQNCDLQAQCRWSKEMGAPPLGELIKVQIVDMFFQGSQATIIVKKSLS